MPREHQKRGRRAEHKKRKHEATEDAEGFQHAKRQKSLSADGGEASLVPTIENPDDYHLSLTDRPDGPPEAPFFGLLDDQEQEYFKRADDMLELNQFDGPEERSLFLANVYREADGKELRLANSQSCSRLLERLILLSTPAQLKNLFQKFSGNFLHLVQHRFASHCCEALFLQSAPVVSRELAAGGPKLDDGDPNEIVESMENLFLYTINELEGFLGYLMTDRFASHTLRVLLVVLSGQPLEASARKGIMQSRKKEHISITGLDAQSDSFSEPRTVPASFHAALEKLIHDCVSQLDSAYLRVLATHKIGNPVLQLLLQTELTLYGKQRARDEASLLHKLLPDDPITHDSESAVFINGLVYDPIGSRLLEAIVVHAPGKLFKNLYKQFFQERLPTLARNEIAGYVACKVLERLGKDDLQEAAEAMTPHVPRLVERNRIVVIRSLIDSCAARGVDTRALASALQDAYTGTRGFDIARLLKLGDSRHASDASSLLDVPTPPSSSPTKAPITHYPAQASEKLHSSLLAQSMLGVPGPLSGIIFDGLAQMSGSLILKSTYDPSASRVIQTALIAPHATIIFRRRLIQTFYGEIGAMALDPSASRVIDAIWNGTKGLAFIRERIAEELAENEASLRESGVGRHVWRRWEMDLWKRMRGEWVRKCRESVGTDVFPGWPEGEAEKSQGRGGGAKVEGPGKKKTPIQLAMERHAAKKAKSSSRKDKGDSHAKHRSKSGSSKVEGGRKGKEREQTDSMKENEFKA